MSIEIIKERVKKYLPSSLQEEENPIKEIYQEIALAGLARANFFKIAAFQGETCLRIIYKLNRFSEDLDFILFEPSKDFNWHPFLKAIKEEFASYSIDLEVKNPANLEKNIKKAAIKDSSFLKILELKYDRNKSDRQKISIKFEVDINPPKGSVFENHYLDFPLPFSIISQDKKTLFASKCHALLCRPFLKGRDWYDFLWYVINKVQINYDFLKNALIQTGNWHYADRVFNKSRLIELLSKKVFDLDFVQAAIDVKPLLKPIDRQMLPSWNREFFLGYIEKLNEYLKDEVQKTVLFKIAQGPFPLPVQKLFSGALVEFDKNEIENINKSEIFYCQPIKDILALDNKNYKVIFINIVHPSVPKDMSGSHKLGKEKMKTYIPGKIYELPGWFIKDWNSRKIIYYNNVYRLQYWFQPVDITPKNIISIIQNNLSI